MDGAAAVGRLGGIADRADLLRLTTARELLGGAGLRPGRARPPGSVPATGRRPSAGPSRTAGGRGLPPQRCPVPQGGRCRSPRSRPGSPCPATPRPPDRRGTTSSGPTSRRARTGHLADAHGESTTPGDCLFCRTRGWTRPSDTAASIRSRWSRRPLGPAQGCGQGAAGGPPCVRAGRRAVRVGAAGHRARRRVRRRAASWRSRSTASRIPPDVGDRGRRLVLEADSWRVPTGRDAPRARLLALHRCLVCRMSSSCASPGASCTLPAFRCRLLRRC